MENNVTVANILTWCKRKLRVEAYRQIEEDALSEAYYQGQKNILTEIIEVLEEEINGD